MGCFGQIKVFKKPKKHQNHQSSSSEDKKIENDSLDLKKINEVSNVKMFTFNEMEAATNKFSGDSFLGEGGFGKVYKGHLDRIDEVVAIKQLNHSGMQGASEFFTEVALLGKLHHPNLVKLFGCCAEGNQKLLIYEYMPLGSLDRHLHDVPPDRPRLDWNTRMKIAAGAALGLDFLHNKAVPAVIYRDMKCSNILLGEGYHPKLSDFGLAKVAPMGDQTHISTRVMGTPGYCAPDYLMSGRLTVKSDVFCFGVALLEILTGRKAYERLKSGGERTLVEWARPLFKDRKKFPHMVDPTLQGQYPPRGLYQALAVAAMCVQEQADMRPDIADVVTALSFLASQVYNPEAQQPRTRVAPSTPQARSNTDKSDETEGRKSI